MSKLLYIQASPMGDRSYSNRAAQAFLEGYRETHPNDVVETIDLWSTDLPDFDATAASGKYKAMRQMPHSEEEARAWQRVVETIEHFKSADQFLISCPMWNFSIPYRLKQYIDILVQAGLTFSYDPDQGYSGLVTGRPMQLILARAGEYPSGTEAAAMDYQRNYLEHIMGFMGFNDVRTIVVEPTIMAGPQVAEERAAVATGEALEAGRNFASERTHQGV